MIYIKDCLSGHSGHDTITVKKDYGIIEVYNYEEYKNTKKYCPGKDDISKKILEDNIGERFTIIRRILEKPTKKKKRLFIDFGSHIGLYMILASKLGYDSCGFETNPEHILMSERNAANNGLMDKIFIESTPVTKTMPKATIGNYYKEIYFIHINLDKNVKEIFRVFDNLLKERKVANIFLENVKPSCEKVISKVVGYGYESITYENDILIQRKK